MKTFLIGVIASLLIGASAMAQDKDTFKGSDTLPQLLMSENGQEIKTLDEWQTVRRPELLKIFTEEMYGCMPGLPEEIKYTVFESSTNALEGIATRKQITISMLNKGHQTSVDLLLYLPNAVKKPAPLFLTLNFKGNHAISDEPEIKICEKMMAPSDKTPYPRADASSRWPLKLILGQGYALATMARGDIAIDGKGYPTNNVLGLFPELQNRDDNFSTIGAWAWTLSRALDYLEKQPEINPEQVVVLGHSRLGKTALWAGANDPRFSAVISNDSGAGGAALSRRMMGETIGDLCKNFPYWFCEKFQKYVGHDKEMPFDQHQLMALIAPRHIYVASAQDDAWADPEGEFTSLMLANSVFELFGIRNALPGTKMPSVNSPLRWHNGYHMRTGKHDLTEYDWQNYIDFLDKHFKHE